MIQVLDRDILLHPIEQPSMSKGGLHKPDAWKHKPVKGIVITKGPNCKYKEITHGDVVLVSAYAGEKVTLEDEGIFWLVQEDDIAAKLLAEPKIKLVDTETLKRIIDEVAGEYFQKNKDVIGYVNDYIGDLEARLNDLTQNEGMEF